MIMNIYSLLDIAIQFKHRVLLRPPARPVADRMWFNVAARFANVRGTVNAHNRVSSRTLVVPASYGPRAEALGAVYDAATNTYVVPDALDEKDAKFAPFWPSAPRDLQNQEGRAELSRDGQVIESLVHPHDRLQGGDSTALFLMYAALPIIGAVIAALTSIPVVGWLAWLLLPAVVPYIRAIARSEKAPEAFRATVLTFVLPLAAAKGFLLAAGSSGIAFGVFATILNVYLFLGLLYCLIAPVEQEDQAWGGRWTRIKGFALWNTAGLVAIGMTMLFPSVIGGFLWFVMAGAYGFVYYARDYKERTLVLQSQSARFNLGKQGLMEDFNSQALEAQVRKALADPSPFIQWGVALGHLRKKGVKKSYDTDSPAGISIEDLFMHAMIWAETGMGKSAYIRWLMAEILKSGYPCAFAVFCGKGALAGEVRGMLDMVIETGVHLGLIEGLDAQGLKAALTNTKMEDDNADIWTGISSLVIDHAAVILEALHHHELMLRALDAAKKLELETEIEGLLQVKDQDEANGKDVADIDEALARLGKELGERINALSEEREWKWTLERFDKLIQAIGDVRADSNIPGEGLLAAANYIGVQPIHLGNDEDFIARKADWAERLAKAPQTIHPDLLQPGSLLQQSFGWVLKTWPAFAAETRGSFMANVQNRLVPLMRGKYLVDDQGVPWHSIEHGSVNVGDMLKGTSMGVNVPDTRHGTAGILVQNLISQRLYTGIKLRNEVSEAEWRGRGELPVIQIMDECQNLIGREEQRILPISRSTKMACIYATQGYEGILAKLPEAAAQQFCNSFQNWALYRTSPQSYEYMELRFGVEEMTMFKHKTAGLDYDGGLDMVLDNALFDPNHPNAAGMKQLRKAGAGRVVATHIDPVSKARWVGQKFTGIQATKDLEIPANGRRESQPLFSKSEFNGLLNQQGRAILWFNRAGVRRADICKTPFLPLDKVDDVVKAIKASRAA